MASNKQIPIDPDFEIDPYGLLEAYHGAGGHITVPDGVKRICARVFKDRTDITAVTLPASVTSIAEQAFYGAAAMESINLSAVERIERCAFFGCSSLSEVSVERAAFLDSDVFGNCRALARVILPKKTRTIPPRVFMNAVALESIALPDTDLIGAEAFSHCPSLRRVTFGEGLSKLERSAFRACTGLREVVIHGERLRFVESGAFRDCEALARVVITAGFLLQIESDAFADCRALREVYLGAGVRDIGWNAFGNCPALSDVYFEGTKKAWRDIGGEKAVPPAVTVHFGAKMPE